MISGEKWGWQSSRFRAPDSALYYEDGFKVNIQAIGLIYCYWASFMVKEYDKH